jgi:spermidine synthase
MGATLPLLAAALTRAGRGFGAALGWAYGWNTLGAVAGALGAELLFVPRVGVGGTAWMAAVLCLIAAILASRSVDATKSRAPNTESRAPTTERSDTRWNRGAATLLISSFLSGATLLGLEVVWFRFLTMFVLSTTLAATTMLAVVLASIGLGGLIASAWLTRSPGAWRHLPALAFWAGVGVVSSYAGFQLLTSGTQIAEWYRTVWLAGALTAPVSIVSGMLFTFTGAALDRVLGDGPRTAGWVALSNTAGSMCGPLVATFVLLPRAGVEGSFLAAAVAYAAVGLLAAAGAAILGARLRSPGLAGAAATLAAALAFFPNGLMAGTYSRASRRGHGRIVDRRDA